MARRSSLSNRVIEKITSYRYDRIIEKHEGPENWSAVLTFYNPEFIEIDGRSVLLPIDQKQHQNITILRSVVDNDRKLLTIFLKDTTYVEESGLEHFTAGFIAICEKVVDEDFFIAVVYHEWFIIPFIT